MTVLPNVNSGGFLFGLSKSRVEKISAKTFLEWSTERYILFNTDNAFSSILLRTRYLGVSGTINNSRKNISDGTASVANMSLQPMVSIHDADSPKAIP